MSTETVTTTYNAYQLARMADVASPDSLTSPGAVWLSRFPDRVFTWNDNDEIAQEADDAVPIYTNELWQVFTDLAAWSEDISDWGPIEDMGKGAQLALYAIGERLLHALLEAYDEAAADAEAADEDSPAPAPAPVATCVDAGCPCDGGPWHSAVYDPTA